MRSILFLALGLVAFGAHANQITESCTLANCELRSLQQLEDLRSENLKDRFMNDPANIEEFRQIHSRLLWNDSPFETWYEKEIDYRINNLTYAMDTFEKGIKDLEKTFKVKIPNDALIFDTLYSFDHSAVHLAKSATCIMGKKKGKRKKDCNSRRRSCGGQFIYLLTLGGAGSRDCRPAFARCEYERSWDLLIKTQEKKVPGIKRLTFSVNGNHSVPEHRIIMYSVAKQARRVFDYQDERINDLVKSLPACESESKD